MAKISKFNFICLAVLCLLGNTLITITFTGNTADDIVGIFAAIVTSMLTVITIKYVMESGITRYIKEKNCVYGAVLISICLLLSLVIVFTVYNFSQFASVIMLQTQNIFFPFVSIFAIALFLGISCKKVLYKLSAIILPLTLLIIIFVFAYSVRFMGVKYFIPYKNLDSDFFSSFFSFYLNLTLSSVSLLIIGRQEKKRVFACSYVVLLIVLCIGVATTLGIFGSELASTLKYPYLSAVSTAAMGEIFSRFDGFFYFVCFFSVLIKTASLLYSFKEIFLKFLNFTIEKCASMW